MRRQQAAAEFRELIQTPPDWAATWRLSELANTLPGVGGAAVAQLRVRLRADPRIGRLTGHQRCLVHDWADSLWPYTARGGRCLECGGRCGWGNRLCFDCRYSRGLPEAVGQ